MASDNYNYNVTYQSVQQGVESPGNAIFIDNSPVVGDLLHVTVSSVSGGSPIILQGGQGSAGTENYHFTILFEAGELAQVNGIALAADQVTDWDLHVEDDRSNGTMLYFLRRATLTLTPDAPFTVTLQKVGARPKTGPRTTYVRFTWVKEIAEPELNGLGPQDPPVAIINFERKSIPPLSVGFDTTNMVLCDGSYQNALMLRIVNLGSFPIELDPAQCKLTLSFDTSTDTSQLWALSTPDQAKAFYLPGKLDSGGGDDGWPGHDAWVVKPSDDSPEWQLTPKTTNTALAAGSSLEIPISNIITGHPTGRALLRVQYQGFQEYVDGQFTVEIQKTPLIYWGTGSRVQGLGVSHVNGTAELRTWVNNSQGGLGTFSSHPLQLFTNSEARLTLTTDGKLGIGTTTPVATLDVRGDAAISGSLEFSGHDRQMLALLGADYGVGVQGVDVQGGTTYFRSSGNFGFYKGGGHCDLELEPGDGGVAMMAIRDGRVGIGTTVPLAMLDVRGGAAVTEKLAVGGDATVGGNATVSGNANVGGTLGFGSDNRQMIDLWGSSYGIGVQANTLYLRSYNDFAFYSGGSHSDTALDPGFFGRTPMVIKSSGQILINGQSPMVVQQYSAQGLAAARNIDTGRSSRDWVACIVGFHVGEGPLTIEDVHVEAVVVDDKWSLIVTAGFNQSCEATVLFVRRELCTIQQ